MELLKRILLAFVLPVFLIAPAGAQSREIKKQPAVSGRVVVDGKPADGMTIALRSDPARTGVPVYELARTDREGRYSFDRMPEGKYELRPLAPELVEVGQDLFRGSRKEVTIEPNRPVIVDFLLTRGGVITGRMTDPGGWPAIGELVRVTNVDGQREIPFIHPAPVDFNTDDRGEYRIYGIPPGHYIVSVGEAASPPSVGRSRQRFLLTLFPGVTDEKDAQVLEIKPGSVLRDIDIQIASGIRTYVASGRVIDAETGKPVCRAILGYLRFNAERSYWSTYSTPSRSDCDGRFSITGMVPGSYAVTASMFEGGSYVDPVPIEIRDENVSDILLQTRRGSSIRGRVSVVGTARPEVIAKLPHLSISAQYESQGAHSFATKTVMSARLSADGRFELTRLPAGRMRFILGSTSAGVGFRLLRVELGGADRSDGFELGEAQDMSDVHVLLSYGSGGIRGHVKLDPAELPPGALVFVLAYQPGQPDYSGHRAVVDASWSFSMESLEPGDYEVAIGIWDRNGHRVELRGLLPPPRRVSVPDGKTVEVELGVESRVRSGGKQR